MVNENSNEVINEDRPNDVMTKNAIFTNHLKVQADLEKKGVFIVIIVFLFFGLSDLFSQIYIAEIIQFADPSLNIELPNPTYEAIYRSVFSDLLSTGIIVGIFFGFRAFSAEISVDKQIHYFLSRPINRKQYYLIKSIMRILGLILGIFLSSIIVYFLAALYLPPIDFNIILAATFIVALGVVANFNLVLMFNAKFNSGKTAFFGGTFFFLQIFISSFSGFVDWLKWVAPMNLSSIWSDILLNQDFSDLLGHSIVLMIWVVVPLIVGTYWYNNRDL